MIKFGISLHICRCTSLLCSFVICLINTRSAEAVIMTPFGGDCVAEMKLREFFFLIQCINRNRTDYFQEIFLQ